MVLPETYVRVIRGDKRSGEPFPDLALDDLTVPIDRQDWPDSEPDEVGEQAMVKSVSAVLPARWISRRLIFQLCRHDSFCRLEDHLRRRRTRVKPSARIQGLKPTRSTRLKFARLASPIRFAGWERGTHLSIFTVLRTTAQLFISPCGYSKNCMVIRKSVQLFEELCSCSKNRAVVRRTVQLFEELCSCSKNCAVVRRTVQLFEELCSCSKNCAIVRKSVQFFEERRSCSKIRTSFFE